MDALESCSTDSGHGLRRDFVRRDVLLLSPARRTPAAQPPARSSRRPLSQEEGASASWPPCVQQAEARKEAARFILAYCLASLRAASGGKEGSGGERANERRQGRKRRGIVRRWRPSSASATVFTAVREWMSALGNEESGAFASKTRLAQLKRLHLRKQRRTLRRLYLPIRREYSFFFRCGILALWSKNSL